MPEPSSFVAGFSWHTGRIVKNYPAFPDRGYALLGEVSLGFQTRGRQYWHRAIRFPEAGVSFLGGALGNTEVLGQVAAFSPYLQWKLNQSTLWHLHLKVGLGFAWFTHPFNETTNPANTLMGSSLANVTQASLGMALPVNRTFQFTAGISMFHFSNGHTQLPNLGINMPCLYAGLKFGEHLPRITEVNQLRADTTPDRYQMVVEVTGGYHEFGESTEPVGGATCPVYGLAAGIRWLPDKLHVFSLTTEWNYYTSFRDFAVLNNMVASQTWLYASTFVLYAGHEYMLGHFAIDTRVGLYLYNPFRHDYQQKILDQSGGARLYNSNKLGLNWYFFSPEKKQANIRAGIYIKANLGQADYAAASLAFIF